MPGDDRRDHKLTNFGKLKLEGFGPEATDTAPVSGQLHNAINDISLKIRFFAYISAAESIGVSSTTFT